jgi:hypothetical protein
LSFLGFSVFAQDLSNDYKVINVNKKVRDIAYENPYASPLENYVAHNHLWINGGYDTLQSEMTVQRGTPSLYPKKYADIVLNSEIDQVIIYKDSIGFVFRKEDNYYVVGYTQLENGKWMGRGEDWCFAKNMNETKQYIENRTMPRIIKLHQYYRQKVVSTDTVAFINYLKKSGENPKKYLLEKITDYPLVIYGEIHRRQLSWNLLKNLINDPDFVKKCGTIFMELPSNCQPLFDKFLQSDTLDTALILNILGREQVVGWYDKGEYEFIQEIWKINKETNNKIKIISVDFQLDWDSIQTRDDYEFFSRHKEKDRDSTMAEIIYSYMQNKNDSRNCLFVVGQYHAQKSSSFQPIKAGTLLKQLTENNPKMQIFSTISHAMISDNIDFLGEVRHGLFDYAFEKNENTPIAFDLKNSPFGNEPFDASNNYEYGNYEDFYDGYIFLCPLKDEPYDYEIKELCTPAFLEEMKRRIYIMNSDILFDFDIPAEGATVEKIHELFDSSLQESNNKKYWKFYNK